MLKTIIKWTYIIFLIGLPVWSDQLLCYITEHLFDPLSCFTWGFVHSRNKIIALFAQRLNIGIRNLYSRLEVVFITTAIKKEYNVLIFAVILKIRRMATGIISNSLTERFLHFQHMLQYPVDAVIKCGKSLGCPRKRRGWLLQNICSNWK